MQTLDATIELLDSMDDLLIDSYDEELASIILDYVNNLDELGAYN